MEPHERGVCIPYMEGPGAWCTQSTQGRGFVLEVITHISDSQSKVRNPLGSHCLKSYFIRDCPDKVRGDWNLDVLENTPGAEPEGFRGCPESQTTPQKWEGIHDPCENLSNDKQEWGGSQWIRSLPSALNSHFWVSAVQGSPLGKWPGCKHQLGFHAKLGTG